MYWSGRQIRRVEYRMNGDDRTQALAAVYFDERGLAAAWEPSPEIKDFTSVDLPIINVDDLPKLHNG